MNRLINFLGNRLKPFLVKKNSSRIKNNFDYDRKNKSLIDSNRKLLYNIVDNEFFFSYKDNSWNAIKHIEIFMWNDLFSNYFFKKKIPNYLLDNSCHSNKVQYFPNEIRCYSQGEKNDWIFLKFNKSLNTPFILSFEAKINSINSEFQIAFNYQNIGKRYRFNLKNNNVLSFDVVADGCFVNNIYSEKLSLQLGLYNNFQIVIKDCHYQYIVNDIVILTIREKNPVIKGNEFVFILWDSFGKPIDVTYKNIKLYKL